MVNGSEVFDEMSGGPSNKVSSIALLFDKSRSDGNHNRSCKIALTDRLIIPVPAAETTGFVEVEPVTIGAPCNDDDMEPP